MSTLTEVAPVEHAELSPSSADTWIECAASIAMQRGQPDDSSEYADEGTAAHTLMAWCLLMGGEAADYLGRVIQVGTVVIAKDEKTGEEITGPRRTFEVDEEMAQAVQLYVDAVRERINALQLAGAVVELLVEQRVSIEHITGERGAKGTSDTVLIAVWPDGRAEAEVRDLKYGRGVQVGAERNRQLMIYADAALEEHSDFYNFDAVNIVIHQPRVDEKPSEWRTSQDELIAWIDVTARPAAMRAMQIAERMAPPEAADFNPGEKQCRFCKAKAVCPALAMHVEQTVGAEFEALAEFSANPEEAKQRLVNDVMVLDNAVLGVIYPSLPLIESWAKAVLARIEHELLAGHAVPGTKLVQGRRGARQWESADDAEKTLKGMRLKNDQMYNFKLISPTQAEKLLAKDSPRRWKKVEALITQRDGAPSVAPESDKRPALVMAPPEDDFEPVTIDDGGDLV